MCLLVKVACHRRGCLDHKGSFLAAAQHREKKMTVIGILHLEFSGQEKESWNRVNNHSLKKPMLEHFGVPLLVASTEPTIGDAACWGPHVHITCCPFFVYCQDTTRMTIVKQYLVHLVPHSSFNVDVGYCIQRPKLVIIQPPGAHPPACLLSLLISLDQCSRRIVLNINHTRILVAKCYDATYLTYLLRDELSLCDSTPQLNVR